MIDKSWAWAASKKLVRTNPVHGEEEAKLTLEDWFENNNEAGEMRHISASGEFEDSVAIKYICSIFGYHPNTCLPYLS